MRVEVEFLGSGEGEGVVAEVLASDTDEIGLSFLQNLFGLLGLGDESNSDGGDLSLIADTLGVRNLVSGLNIDANADVSAGRNVNNVNAESLELTGEFDGIVDSPSSLLQKVGGRDADEQGLGPGGANLLDSLENKTGAVLEAASVLIRAVVGNGRQEVVDEISVSSVDLDHIEAGLLGANSGGNKLVLDLMNLLDGQLVRDSPLSGIGDGRRTNNLPSVGTLEDGGSATRKGSRCGGLTTGMADLDTNQGTLRVSKVDNALVVLNLAVLMEGKAERRDAPLEGHTSGLNDDKTSTTHGKLSIVDMMVLGGVADASGVLAHGRDNNAVLEDCIANGDGLEELGDRGSRGISRDGSIGGSFELAKLSGFGGVMLRPRENVCRQNRFEALVGGSLIKRWLPIGERMGRRSHTWENKKSRRTGRVSNVNAVARGSCRGHCVGVQGSRQ